MLWNKLITGNCAEDFGIYLIFLKEFKENKQSKVEFCKETAAKNQSFQLLVVPGYSNRTFYRGLQL